MSAEAFARYDEACREVAALRRQLSELQGNVITLATLVNTQALTIAGLLRALGETAETLPGEQPLAPDGERKRGTAKAN